MRDLKRLIGKGPAAQAPAAPQAAKPAARDSFADFVARGPQGQSEWEAWAARVAEGAGREVCDDAAAAFIEQLSDPWAALAGALVLKAFGRHAAAAAVRRSAPALGRTVGERIVISVRGASEDEEFQALVASADAARDAGATRDAEHLYFRALELFPLHPGYRVQYAHALKDQENFAAAEVHYRSALAAGAPVADVSRHLQFVMQRQGHVAPPPPPAPAAAAAGDPMLAAPTLLDLTTLAWLFWQAGGIGDDDALRLLRTCPTCQDVAVAMTRDPRFASANRDFLSLLKAQA